jgi:hypothetical protein
MIAEGLPTVLASIISNLSTSIVHMTRPCDCRHEYGEAELTLELVSSMDEAIDHLHAHGSGHTECIITGESQGLHFEMHSAHTAHCSVLCTGNVQTVCKHLPHAHAVVCMLSFVRCSVPVICRMIKHN